MAGKINKNRHRLSRVFKRALALFIIVIINFNSFSAVVSSNDGSAFIIKAEFDALVNDFNSRIEDYEKSIDAKIDGAIAEYLAGLASTIVTELINNLNKLQNNYDVYWCNQTTGLLTSKVKYGASYELQIGGRGTTLNKADARMAAGTSSVQGDFLNFPVISSNTANGKTFSEINYWEERQPFVNYYGFFIYNGTGVTSFMSSKIEGYFGTYNFNPNINRVSVKQDKWWSVLDTTGSSYSPWAMTIWALYSTLVQNRDSISIFIYPNAGNTYCWNESDTRLSTGMGNKNTVVPNMTNSGAWSTSPYAPTLYTGSLNITGFVPQNGANFPWCHSQISYKTLYDSRITLTTGVPAPISDGLLLSEFKGPGKITIYMQAERSAPIELKVTKQDTGAEVKSLNGTVNTTETKFELDLKDREGTERFYIWLKYLPSTKSVIHVDSILFETEA